MPRSQVGGSARHKGPPPFSEATIFKQQKKQRGNRLTEMHRFMIRCVFLMFMFMYTPKKLKTLIKNRSKFFELEL